MLEESAVRANTVAEGNVDVEVHVSWESASPAASGGPIPIAFLVLGKLQNSVGILFHFRLDAGFLRIVSQRHVVFRQGAVAVSYTHLAAFGKACLCAQRFSVKG